MPNQVLQSFSKLKVYLANTSWIILDKVVVLGFSLLVTVVLARYLGPEQFGLFSYAISLVALIGIAGHAGLSGLVVKELVKKPDEMDLTMGSSFFIKGLGYLFGFVIVALIAFFTETIGSNQFWILIVLALGLLLKPFDVIDFWFQSRLEAKYTSIARIIAVSLGSIAKLLLAFIGSGLILIAMAYFVQSVLLAFILVFFFLLKNQSHSIKWRYSTTRMKELFNQGWLIFLGSVFAIIYLKVDQVMINWLIGAEEVGIYAVAAALSEAWYFLPVAIVASFFPKLINLHKDDSEIFHYRLQQLLDFLFMLALLIAVLVSFLAFPLISFLFGEEYEAAAPILVIHIWAAIFIFMRAALSKWILIENVLVFSLITQGLGALFNVLLNLWWIPLFGGVGAAYATLVSYAIASYFALIFHKKTRVVFIMMTKSLVSPLRIPFYRKQIK